MISVCMIVKNEEKNIEKCLERLLQLNWEVVVVDTGSIDQTRDIALKYTNKVYEFPWIDDFSAARNFSIEKAENDMVLVIDSDEMITDFDKRKIEYLAQKNPKGIGRLTRINEFIRGGKVFRGHERVSRLFNRQYYMYEGIIHEQIVPRQENVERAFYNIPLIAEHGGYDGELEVRKKKTERNIRLLEKQLFKERQEKPHYVPYTLYQLGKSYHMQEDYKKANEYFSEGLSYDLDIRLEYVQDMVEIYGYSLLEAEEYQTAMGLLGVYNEFCTSTDFVFLCGVIYMNNACFPEAIREFKIATSRKNFKMEGVNSYMAWYNMGVIYECLGDRERARECYNRCGEYEPALKGLERLNKV